MPVSLVSENCWISLRRLADKAGVYKTYVFCVSKMRGLQCPRDKKGGKKPYEVCPACFETIGSEEFLSEVIYPGLIEPRTSEPEQTRIVSDDKKPRPSTRTLQMND
jgi:hypothetical protein